MIDWIAKGNDFWLGAIAGYDLKWCHIVRLRSSWWWQPNVYEYWLYTTMRRTTGRVVGARCDSLEEAQGCAVTMLNELHRILKELTDVTPT